MQATRSKISTWTARWSPWMRLSQKPKPRGMPRTQGWPRSTRCGPASFFSLTQDKASAMAACMEALKLDPGVRSRRSSFAPRNWSRFAPKQRRTVPVRAEAVIHTPPPANPKAELEFVALANQVLTPEHYFVMYWRTAGTEAEFTGENMVRGRRGAELGVFQPSAGPPRRQRHRVLLLRLRPAKPEHRERRRQNGSLLLKMDENAVMAGAGAAEGDGEDGEEDDEESDEPKKKRKRKTGSGLPRVFINLGVGTGIGIRSRERGTHVRAVHTGAPQCRLRPSANKPVPSSAGTQQGTRSRVTPRSSAATSTRLGGSVRTPVPFDATDPDSVNAFANTYDAEYCGSPPSGKHRPRAGSVPHRSRGRRFEWGAQSSCRCTLGCKSSPL